LFVWVSEIQVTLRIEKVEHWAIQIIDQVSSTQEWVNYIKDIKDWLTLKRPLVQEVASQEV